MRDGFIGDIWRYRELLYFFAWRDIKVRYRQASLGAAWAIIQPLFSMIIFTLIFGRLAHMPSDGIPYPIFAYCALVPWTYFSGVVPLASNSLVGNSSLVTKVYFPRVLLPAATALAGLLDFVVGSALLVVLMAYYHIHASWLLLLAPAFMLVMIMVTTGIGMLMAALNVRYRDVKYVVPFLLQLWMFATPIAYPSSVVPARFRFLLALNPFWGIVDGFRACTFTARGIDFTLFTTSMGMAVAVLLTGAYYFHKVERDFADVI